MLVIPLDFNSAVHPLINSCTSSGSTVFRVHASSHRGTTGATLVSGCWTAPLFLDTFAGPSPFFFLENNPMIAYVVVVY
jgi:hypothetical protein